LDFRYAARATGERTALVIVQIDQMRAERAEIAAVEHSEKGSSEAETRSV